MCIFWSSFLDFFYVYNKLNVKMELCCICCFVIYKNFYEYILLKKDILIIWLYVFFCIFC